MVMIMERSSVWKSNVEISPNCPRCGCSNTKFCYYNNYSLTQPRYFCKGCRRYWTKGGSLRNVPVGGGCRKNRRGRSLRLSSAVAADGGLHLKNSGFGSTTTVDPIGHSYHGVNSSGSSTFLADHSARPSSGSHIDLALVYANFLNPKPDCKSGAISNIGPEIPELGRHDHHYFDPSLEFSTTSTPDHMTGDGSSIQILPQIPELSFENCCDGSEQIYFCGLDSFPKYHQDRSGHENCAITTDFVLPPLPGQELLWSSHQIMQAATQLAPAMIEPLDHLQTHHQDHDNLLGNWSPFDLPSDDTFPGGVHEKD